MEKDSVKETILENKVNKIIGVFSISLFAGVFLGFLVMTPIAQANILGDWWNALLSPFTKITTSSSPAPQKSAPIVYKPVVDYENMVIQAVKKASPSVVSIVISKNVPIIENCPFDPFGGDPFFGNGFQFSVPCQKGTQFQEVGGGSGFIITSSGMILTNKHVVADAGASYTVFTNDGKKYEAKVLARDPAQDLAVIKIEGQNFPAVELGDSDGVELGQSAIAIGNALGEFRNTVSVGVISGLARTVTASGGGNVETIQGVMQTDAAINPGNSGGPLLNLKGQVIGINTAIASGAQNIGFAIPINRAKRDINSVISSGEIVSPFIGIRYTLITPDVQKAEKLSVDHGALVKGTKGQAAIIPGSPAEKAGIKEGDVILEVNGKEVDKNHDLGTLISELNVGATVNLKINRKGQELIISVTLAKRPQSS